MRALSLKKTNVQSIDFDQYSGDHLNASDIRDTAIPDLRPIASLKWAGTQRNLNFRNSPAHLSSPELEELGGIRDAEERTEKILAYLRKLPPYPAPLPWERISPEAPRPDAHPRVIVSNGKIDVAHVPSDKGDLDDPIKARLYERLRSSVSDLSRFGNQYPEVASPANALNQIFASPFEEADLFDIHIEIAVLADLAETNHTRPEPLDADCLRLVRNVTRLGRRLPWATLRLNCSKPAICNTLSKSVTRRSQTVNVQWRKR